MSVESCTNQYSISPSLPGNYVAEPETNEHSVTFVKSDKNAIRQFLHRVNGYMPWYSRPKTLVLSGRVIKFANPTNAIQRLLYRIKCRISPPAPVDRPLTSDNKENPCDLPGRSASAIGKSEAGPPEFNAAEMSALNTIRLSAGEYKGEVAFKFCQLKGSFKKQIDMHSATRRGVCRSLCDHWMACHANGLNFFDGLYIGGQKGQFNIDALVSIKQLRIDAVSSNSLKSELDVSYDWVARHGLNNQNPNHLELVGGDSISVFLDCITDRGCYKEIVLWQDQGGNSGVGHCVATHTAWNGEVRFFDPNFGDFKFPSIKDFRVWFRAKFWPLSRYGYKFTHVGANSFRRAPN